MTGELFRPQGPQTGDGHTKPDDQSLKPDVHLTFRKPDGEVIPPEAPTGSTRRRTAAENDAYLKRLLKRVKEDQKKYLKEGQSRPMGDDYRGMHQQAVAYASQSIGELQEALAMATERCDVAVGAILSAVGLTESTNGQEAMNLIAGCKDRIEEVYASTVQAVEYLQNYGGQF